MVKGLVLAAMLLGVLPFLLGLLVTGLKAPKDGMRIRISGIHQERDNLLFHVAAGYIVMFGLFWIVALPMVWLGQTLSLLVWVYAGGMLFLAVVSLLLNYRRLPAVLGAAVCAVKRFTLCIWAQLLFALGQAAVYLRYQYTNADDAFYVASATTSLATDTVFAFNPYTGSAYTKLPARYVLSPFHAFTATVSKITGLHPAVTAHVVFMVVFLMLAYAVYALIGRMLIGDGCCTRDKGVLEASETCAAPGSRMEEVGYFLVIATALMVFSAYSERTQGLFLLIRLWQGKAVLAGVLLPLVFYMGVRTTGLLCGVKAGLADWALLFLLMCSCCMVSSMGVVLGAVMLGILGVLAAGKHKRIRVLAYVGLCCLPNILCGGIYLWIR